MWIRKSLPELESEQRARRVGLALGVVCVMLLLCVSGLPNGRFNLPVSLRAAALLTAVISVLVWHRRANWRRLHASVRVCGQCNVVKAANNQRACSCGGMFIPLNQMRWLETPPTRETAPSKVTPKDILRPAPAI